MFKPDALAPKTNLTLADLLAELDKQFQGKVEAGWFINWHPDHIYLQLDLYKDFGSALFVLREKVKAHYLSLGWVKVTVTTSGEKGEREGIINITLWKTLEEEPTAKIDRATARLQAEGKLLAEVNDIKAALSGMQIHRTQQKEFDIICLSLANIETIAKTI
jgi:hypothetical protein